MVDLQKSDNDSQTSEAGDANLASGTSRGRGAGGGASGQGDGRLSDGDTGTSGSRDGAVGVAAGAEHDISKTNSYRAELMITYQVWQTTELVVMMGLVMVQGQSVMVMVVG